MKPTPTIKHLPTFISLFTLACVTGCGRPDNHIESILINPQHFQQANVVDERFLSYNVEMVEVTGGRFWAPYVDGVPKKGEDRYEHRPPIDLDNPRLQKLAAALGPSYVRVSGTWANATWFAETDTPPDTPPAGFDAILSHQQWRGLINFANAADANIVMSLATSAGARDSDGVWNTDNARRLFTFTKEQGSAISAVEFANEPNMIGLTQPPENYTPADYHRDYAIFHNFVRTQSPQTLVLAPGAVEMGQPMRTLANLFSSGEIFETDSLFADDSPKPDVVSFHYYGASSQRCHVPLLGSQPEDAFDPDFLAGIDDGIRNMKARRDRIAPMAPLWNTESGETACGGNPWAVTFSDTFRFLDQLARSAKQGVQVFMHNTLAASDYAILNEDDFSPRPNYWAALLWRKLMGTTVLNSVNTNTANLNVYAHCHRSIPGAVTVLAINLDQEKPASLELASAGKVFRFTQAENNPNQAALNGATLKLVNDDSLPQLAGIPVPAGSTKLSPASITFVVFEDAENPACKTAASPG